MNDNAVCLQKRGVPIAGKDWASPLLLQKLYFLATITARIGAGRPSMVLL